MFQSSASLFLIVQRYKFESKSQRYKAKARADVAVPNSSKVQI